MRKIFLALPCFFLLMSCGDNDKDYYLKNLDKANEKMEYCMKAMFSGDKSIKEDKECFAADQAIKENRQLEREKEQKEALIKKQKEEELLQIEKEKQKKELMNTYGDKNWKENITNYANNSCSASYSYSDEYKSANCVAWREFYAEQLEIGQKELNNLTYAQMTKEVDQYCSLDKRAISPCAIFSKIYQEKEEELVNHYVKNPNEMKEVYNKCIDDMDEISKTDKSHWDKTMMKSELTDNYPCKQAAKAKRELNLGYGSFDKKID